MADPVARYGLHDIAAVAALRRPLAIGLYSDIAMVRRMRYPTLRVAVEELCFLHDGTPEPVWADGGAAPGWSRVSRATLAALAAVARREGITILAALDWSFRLGGIDDLSLRLIHRESAMAAPDAACGPAREPSVWSSSAPTGIQSLRPRRASPRRRRGRCAPFRTGSRPTGPAPGVEPMGHAPAAQPAS